MLLVEIGTPTHCICVDGSSQGSSVPSAGTVRVTCTVAI